MRMAIEFPDKISIDSVISRLYAKKSQNKANFVVST